jgi:hypothetical protein
MKKFAPLPILLCVFFFSSVQAAHASWLSELWHCVEDVFDSDKVTKVAPPPHPTPVPKPASTTLPPLKSAMTEYYLPTPQPNNVFYSDSTHFDTPSYFVEFDNAKVDQSTPLYLTTVWSYEGKVVDTMTQSQVITKLPSLNNAFGAWVSPVKANWTPTPWDGQPYQWSVLATWSNQKVEYSNRYPWLGCVGWAISDSFCDTGKLVGGVGYDIQKFTVTPEPVTSVLFLTGSALLAARVRRKGRINWGQRPSNKG